MKNNAKTSAQTPKEILNELHALVAEAEKMMGDNLSEATEDAVSSLRLRFDAAQERMSELYDGVRKQVVAGAKCTDAAIRTHPYESLAVAAGVGLLIGILVTRRN
jgi:ElaB/YqjD/DUF883 family membrane-anchored ribosome-binding protein